MEDGALVAKALLTSAQGAEVLSGLGHDVRPELWNHKTPTSVWFSADKNPQENQQPNRPSLTEKVQTLEDFVLIVQQCLDVGETST